MRKKNRLIAVFLTMAFTIAALSSQAFAAFVSGSTGADGAFEPTANIALQLPDSGVFNFTTVNIPSGVTVTFKKNTQNTPVTILATGDVTIGGTISVNGAGGNYLIPGAGGPGGFDGGQGGAVYQIGKRGEGPGGGGGGGACSVTSAGAAGGGGGGFASNGSSGDGNYSNWGASAGASGSSYGNERILPVIGGSGGGGSGGNTAYVGSGGGAGGGGLVIASSGTITVSGSISANGGNGANGSYMSGGGGGSGGSVRLIANTISGNGSITANGGAGGGGSNSSSGGAGAAGRIRLEASNILRTAATSPPMSLGYPYAVTPLNMPTLSISSIGGMEVPSVPKGAFGAPDVMLPFNTKNPITVMVTGVNIPVGQVVTVKATPSVGNVTNANGTMSGTETSSSASVELSISTAYPSLITASVTFQLAALGGGPIYAEGEKVEKVRVAANLGGGSTVTYITESGREIAAM